MNGVPAINQLIGLRADTGHVFASRVEDAGGSSLTVAKPLDLPAEHDLRVGAKIMTTWHAANGIHTLPCQLVGVRREGLVSLWDIEVIGAGWREQRRDFVRAAVAGTVKLRWSSPEDGEHEDSGVIADLSEAGVRCVIAERGSAVSAPAGAPTELSLKTFGSSFELNGEVVRVTPDLHTEDAASPRWQVVLRFTEHGKVADDIRRIVFKQQLRDRNGR